MINANELRIGDWVIEKGNIKQVYSISNHNAKDYSKIEPIPLTIDWLANFGFLKSNLKRHCYINLYYRIWLNDNRLLGAKYKRFYISHISENRFSLDVGGRKYIDIKYVHQLQNIYFSLTGNELTTTLKPSF
jgi:hypothetical protein